MKKVNHANGSEIQPTNLQWEIKNWGMKVEKRFSIIINT